MEFEMAIQPMSRIYTFRSCFSIISTLTSATRTKARFQDMYVWIRDIMYVPSPLIGSDVAQQ